MPEPDLYDTGACPASCTCDIAPDGAELKVLMRFVVEAGGSEQSVTYGGPTDGSPPPLPGTADGS
jgi:hypothetical protein